MYNDSKILRSEVQEAFANILKLLVSNGVPQQSEHVLPNVAAEWGGLLIGNNTALTDPYVFVNKEYVRSCQRTQMHTVHN